MKRGKGSPQGRGGEGLLCLGAQCRLGRGVTSGFDGGGGLAPGSDEISNWEHHTGACEPQITLPARGGGHNTVGLESGFYLSEELLRLCLGQAVCDLDAAGRSAAVSWSEDGQRPEHQESLQAQLGWGARGGWAPVSSSSL